MKSTLSIDWLQLYCDCSSMKISQNYEFVLMAYQTKQFRKVYDVLYMKEKIAVAVCEPVSPIIQPFAMVVKFSNRVLYMHNFRSIVDDFLKANDIHYKSITRIDLALDFNYFERGVEPESFIRRYLKGDILKTQKCKFSVSGAQRKGAIYEYIRFGSKTSEINTYLYNKTKELKENTDKPYIRERWDIAGLSSKSAVWRLEVSIKSSGTSYLDEATGEYTKIDLSIIDSKELLVAVYQSYIKKYFSFVINDGKSRLDRMQPFVLVDTTNAIYSPIYLPNVTGSKRADKIFLKKLYLMDRELRGFNDVMIERQQDMISDFVSLKNLHVYFADRAPFWDKIHVDEN